MKSFFLTLSTICSLLVLNSCESTNLTGGQEQASETEQLTNANPLEGTWKLVKNKWGDMEDFAIPKREIYKIFTKEHVFFIYYDDKKFYGAGGGTYMINRDSFTETLDYYSWDSTAAGTQQTFKYTVTGNQLHQSGMLENTEKYNDYVIEEYFERVEDGISSAQKDNAIVGVWQYQSGDGNTSDYIKTNNLNAYKVFTPKHWHNVFREKPSGNFHGSGFGTYTLTGNQYTEHIHAFSFDSTAIGQVYPFTLEMKDGKLIQTGKIDTEQYPDYTVRETYVRVE